MSNQIKRNLAEKTEPVRLNKYLSEAGVCSDEADKLIESGRVSVDGKRALTGYEDRSGTESESGNKIVSPAG